MLEAEVAARIGESFEVDRARLVRVVRGRTRDDSLAADLVDEAYCRLVRSAAQGSMPDDPPAWLFRVVMNLVMSWARSRRRIVSGQEATPEPPAVEHDQNTAREDVEEVVAALSSLAHGDRACLVLAARGYGSSEIADLLGWSRGAARTRLCRARKRLRAAAAFG